MDSIRIGMYVRFPVKESGVTTYLYGQICTTSSRDEVKIAVYDLSGNRCYESLFDETYTVKISDIERVPARVGSSVYYNSGHARILPINIDYSDPEKYYEYRIDYQTAFERISAFVSENELKIDMHDADNDPFTLLLGNPSFTDSLYKHREIISESQANLRNAPDGFRSILSTRANLYPHQLDTIVRAFEETPCRLILSDEVGLGKTIEACSILKGLLKKKSKLRALIIVPDSLVEQWYSELKYKFQIKSTIVVNWNQLVGAGVFIAGYKIASKAYTDDLENNALDLCIVDEAHKILSRRLLYNKILAVIKCSHNRLLLSATPVIENSEEFKSLFTLINPTRYETMTGAQFSDLVQKQAVIRSNVFEMVQDLPDYETYDMASDFAERLTAINCLTNDTEISNYIKRIKAEPDCSVSVQYVKSALAYISINYRIDSCIIRHRKSEIAGASAQRVVCEIPYEPAGSAENFYEADCIETIIDKFHDVFRNTNNSAIIEICKFLVQATTSSPYAVLGNTKASGALDEKLNRYLNYIEKWKNAYDWEVENIKLLDKNPQQFHSKLARIIEWINCEDPDGKKKFLIFSEYSQTAEVFFTALKKYYGESSSRLFVKGMNGVDLRDAVYEFQNKLACRFIVCDSSGGEGRNFQMADYIIHCDLSWSPAVMEQRIGRLDRIGRDPEKRVTSVVVHSVYGVENDLFSLYNEGLNLFQSSLCGIEIEFENIQKRINNAFVSDPDSGLRNILPAMKAAQQEIAVGMEEERYYDLARQLDIVQTEQIQKLVEVFSDKSHLYSTTIFEWAGLVGIKNREQKQAFYDKSDVASFDFETMDDKSRIKYAYASPFPSTVKKVLGTFSRSTAVNHERIAFFAPGTALYDSIVQNSERCSAATLGLIHTHNSSVKWEGFCFSWNVLYDYNPLLSSGLPSDAVSLIGRFMSEGRVKVFVEVPSLLPCSRPDVIAKYYELLRDGQELNKNRVYSKDSAIELSSHLSYMDWNNLILTAYDTAISEAKNLFVNALDINAIESHLSDFYNSEKVKAKTNGTYFKYASVTPKKFISNFLNGLTDPAFILDSVSYIVFD